MNVHMWNCCHLRSVFTCVHTFHTYFLLPETEVHVAYLSLLIDVIQYPVSHSFKDDLQCVGFLVPLSLFELWSSEADVKQKLCFYIMSV